MLTSQQLRYIKQFEAFRRLSEAIAHDINNLLSGVLGYSELLLIEPEADHLRSPIEEISKAGKRIATLTRLLSAFGYKHTYHAEIFDFNEVILGIESLIPRILGKEVEFISINTPQLWPVRADPIQMKQALITLAIEMKNLMPEGGKLGISANNLSDSHALATVGKTDLERFVLITATASGNIEKDAVPESLFNSPYTQPNHAEETAYGLQSVHDLLKMANGRLVLDGCSERELRISIYLPAANPGSLPGPERVI